MSIFSKFAMASVTGATVAAAGVVVWAYPPEEGSTDRPPQRDPGPPRPEGRRPPPPPLETALDADNDGEISAREIENAAAVLRKLDKNGDGKLTPDEYRPPRPPMNSRIEGDGGRFDRNRGGDRGAGGREGARPRDGERSRSGDRPREGDREGARRGPPDEGAPAEEGRRRGGAQRDPRAFADHVLQFDENEDGKVTKDELPEQMQQLLSRADTNNDGALDRAELERIAGRGGRRPAPREGDERGDRPRRPAGDE